MNRKRNDIGGDWIADENEIENRSPSNLSDGIGRYAKEPINTVKPAHAAAGLAK